MKNIFYFFNILAVSILISTTGFAGNFAGYWKDRNMDHMIFIYTDDGNNIGGTLSSPLYDHSFFGNHQGPNIAYANVRRVNRNDGCTTIMYLRMTMVNPYEIHQQILGSDGRCDIPTNYTEFRILDRQ